MADSTGPAGQAGVWRQFVGWERTADVAMARAVMALLGLDGAAVEREGLLLVVPTARAGRRVAGVMRMLGWRGVVGVEADDGGRGRIVVVTPEGLIAEEDRGGDGEGGEGGGDRVAGALAERLAWARALLEVDVASLADLFPVLPEREFGWALRGAEGLLRMRSALVEGGLLVGDVAGMLASDDPELGRWRALRLIEEEALRLLEGEMGVADPGRAKIQRAGSPELPAGVGRVVVAGVADPVPLAWRALERLAERVRVDVLVWAPEGEAEGFDAMGRPVAEWWGARELPFDARSLGLAGGPGEVAERVAERLAEVVAGGGCAALGVLDGELSAELARALADRGMAAYDPAGRPLRRHAVYGLLGLVRELLVTARATAWLDLLRLPEVELSCAVEGAIPGAALGRLDDIRLRRLPDVVDEFELGLREGRQEDEPALAALGWWRGWRERLGGRGWAGQLGEFLDELYGGEEWGQEGSAEALRMGDEERGAVAAVRQHVAALEPLAVQGGGWLGVAEGLAVLLDHLGRAGLPPAEREGDGRGGFDLSGWLELAWEDAPELVIAGFHDGVVPGGLPDDPYLPDRLRARLGLRTLAMREARDAHQCRGLLAAREEDGRVSVWCGRADGAGSPLRPSRLLFRVPRGELAARVEQLMAEGEAGSGAAPAWEAPWKLVVPAAAPEIFRRLAVTGFRDYLACPFRFYLKRGLRMESIERSKRELDARDFGNLCHHALERFGLDEGLRDSRDGGEIREFLVGQAEARVYGLYGRRLPLPVQVQLEAARRRLGWLAEQQVIEREAGWVIQRVEWQFHEESPWLWDGMEVRGTVDRVERNERSGAWRVIDYKTSASGKKPKEAHVAKAKGEVPEWRRAGEDKVWKDLQLPLYVIALRERLGVEGDIAAGYFNLTKARSGTKIELWQGMDEELIESARSCVSGVIAAVRAGAFWPPAAEVEYDDCEGLLFGAGEQVVDGDAFEAMVAGEIARLRGEGVL